MDVVSLQYSRKILRICKVIKSAYWIYAQCDNTSLIKKGYQGHKPERRDNHTDGAGVRLLATDTL